MSSYSETDRQPLISSVHYLHCTDLTIVYSIMSRMKVYLLRQIVPFSATTYSRLILVLWGGLLQCDYDNTAMESLTVSYFSLIYKSRCFSMRYKSRCSSMRYKSRCSSMRYKSRCSSMRYKSRCSSMRYKFRCSSMRYKSRCSSMRYTSRCSSMRYKSRCSSMRYTSRCSSMRLG